MPFILDKSQSKRGGGGFKCYQIFLSYSTEVLWDISDSPFVQNKDYQQ